MILDDFLEGCRCISGFFGEVVGMNFHVSKNAIHYGVRE